ncbi:bifunctional glycosyltransferase/CDP-glycerol:glycerophosphate glycerophosphotransferase [Nocardioides cynanchi]|uniref:bifunctional glycosyltransferase/CDP-glycerol:glycerophosphate glycerophosphotransferase n=1 Tax=Nocardioides cynanchi TaxID=2558918 RepID=UPI00178218E6|nr:CDP-glycerol glycerophosphotransferase family protein [Nocardioides cynanchi]
MRVPRLLSVVVPVRESDAELDQCLRALRHQTHPACEVVVVDLGTSPTVADVAARHAQEDYRVRVVRAEGGLAAGRNRGAELAVGEYLAFVDADDIVTRHGFAATLAALEESGSDLAVAAYRPTRRGQVFPVAGPIAALHSVRRLHTSAAVVPDLLANTVTGARVFRRSAYVAGRWRFADLPSCDDAHSVTSYLGATGVDVLTHVGLLVRRQSDRAPLTRRTTDLDGLRALGAGARAAADLLPARLAEVYVAEVIAGPAEAFLDRAWRCPDDYWSELRDLVDDLRVRAGDEAMTRVPAYRKALVALVTADERDRARAFLTSVRPDPRRYATTVRRREGRSVVVADYGPDWSAVSPDDRTLADLQVGVRAEVNAVRVLDASTVELRGWAYLDNVDLTAVTPSLQLVLRSDDGRQVELEVTPARSAEADAASELWVADVSTSGFVGVLDTDRVTGSGVWSLAARLTVDGLEGVGGATIRPWTMAGVPAWTDASRRVLAVDHDDFGRFELRVEPPGTSVADLRLAGDRLLLVVPEGVDRVELEPLPGGPALATSRVDAVTHRADVSLQDLGADARCRLTGYDAAGRRHRLLQPAEPFPDDPRVRAGRRGDVEVVAAARAAELLSVELDGESLVARLRLPSQVAGWETALVEGQSVVPGTTVPAGPGLVEARYPLVQAAWGRPPLPLPSGRYAVAVRNRELTDWVTARPGPDLLSTLPVDALQDRMRLRVETFAPDDPGVRLVVGPPLADDELGRRHQRLLREATRVEVADRSSVFLRAMFSEFANGNGLGLHEELVRRGSSLELLWSVADHSVPVPPGGTGVVELSRAWHEAVAHSRYHVVDVHQLEWFVRPREQVLIQTFHGYPYKLMGHAWWEKMGNSVQEIGSLDRRTREWSALVSPAPYATPLLRAAFLDPAGADDVPILEIGYPRNDALLRPEASVLRTRTRASLGLADDAVAVLYAPTFRDYLSAEDRTARTVSFFDADQALAQLPDNYVLLMRGHAFNARIRADRVRSTERVIDVTDHPDVTELILASDVAVLDYSSLRFDYVLSGKPMVFLVPDLAAYDRARGGLVPYAETAPGPQTTSTEETATWLADLPRLTTQYAEARRRFRSDFVGLDDGQAASRLVDALFVPRGDG